MSKEKLQTKLEKEAVKRNKGMCDSYEYCEYCKDKEGVARATNTPCADAYNLCKQLEDKLKSYKQKKAYIETLRLRINLYKQALSSTSDEMIDDMFDDTPESTLGMPKAKYRISSPTEQILIKKELKRQTVEEWVRIEQNRLSSAEYDIKKIDNALNSLEANEYFIITAKYIHKMSIEGITEEYNYKYLKEGRDVLESAIRKRIERVKKKIAHLV